MRLCFVVEARYVADSMPLQVADRLIDWGHDVTIVQPSIEPVDVGALAASQYDAVVLKTVSDGPGLTLLEMAAATGKITVNEVSAIRRTRDKAVAIGLACHHGLPVPATWFAPTIDQLGRLSDAMFPMVVKPANGSSGERVHLAATPGDLSALADRYPPVDGSYWLGQEYLPNPGVDLKLYATGEGVYAEMRTSPLQPLATEADRLVPVPPDLVTLMDRVGQIFGLDIFGIDLVQSADGWVIVDINDFPSFRLVPDAAGCVARTILRLAEARRPRALDEALR